MKYIVLLTLVGFNQCDGDLQYSDFSIEVTSEQECFDLAKEYIELPFVVIARCEIEINTISSGGPNA
jgi:hypothetical protein